MPIDEDFAIFTGILVISLFYSDVYAGEVLRMIAFESRLFHFSLIFSA